MCHRNIRYGPSECRKSVPPKPPSYEDDGQAAHMPRTDQRRADSRGTCTPSRVRPPDSTCLLFFFPEFPSIVVVEGCWEVCFQGRGRDSGQSVGW